MKILLTGATGFAGGRILEHLSASFGPEQICGTGRNEKALRAWRERGVEMYGGDLTDAHFVENLFRKSPQPFEAIVHVAAKSAPWGSDADFYQHNVLATQHLLTLARETGVRRFVYISTPSVYFNFSHRLNVLESEAIDYPLVNAYTRTKYEAEQSVLDSAANAGRLFAIALRPRAILGRGDTVIAPRVLRAYQEGRLRVVGDGQNMADFTAAANLAHAVGLALQTNNEACRNQVFNITDGQPQLLWDVLRFLLQSMGLPNQLRHAPYPLAYAAAWCSEKIHGAFFPEKEPALTCYGVGVLRYSITMNIEKARSLLGYAPVLSTEDAVCEYVHWISARGRM